MNYKLYSSALSGSGLIPKNTIQCIPTNNNHVYNTDKHVLTENSSCSCYHNQFADIINTNFTDTAAYILIILQNYIMSPSLRQPSSIGVPVQSRQRATAPHQPHSPSETCSDTSPRPSVDDVLTTCPYVATHPRAVKPALPTQAFAENTSYRLYNQAVTHTQPLVRLWNELPADLRRPNLTFLVFKQKLKTYLLGLACSRDRGAL